MNKVTLIGRLGRDPEARYTQGGSCVCNLAVATTERRKDGDNWVEHTEWHRVTVFGKRAETVAEHLRKGSQVGIAGRLQSREWEKDGHKNRSTDIIADEVEFLGSRQGGEKPAPKPAAKPTPAYDDDDSIPF